MYKLVAVAGKLRGEEFPLEEGENIIGRSEECDVTLPVEGVSKQHFSISVTGDVAYLKDLGSANGTFVNKKIVKRATVKNKDKIALPDTILQVVYVKEKKKIIKKRVSNDENDEPDFLTGGEMPDNFAGKLFWLFRYRFMPVIHGIHEEYEWRFLFGVLLAIFVVTTVTLTIFPILQTSKGLLLSEVAKRGELFAEQIKRANKKALSQKDLDRVDTTFLEDPSLGIDSYDLFDIDGRIVRPLTRLNQYIDNPFSVRVREWAEATRNSANNSAFKTRLEGGVIGIGQKIKATNIKTGESDIVGVIAIRFKPRSLKVEAAKSQVAYLESLITSFLASIVFFGILYYLTLRPLEEMKFQIEEALRGKRRGVEGTYLWSEINPLASSINVALQRLRELQSDGSDDDFAEIESDETYVAQLYEFMRGSNGPVLVLDSEKNLSHINNVAEDITGIRESSSQGMSLLDVAREKGFAATVIELCDSSAENGGTSQQGDYELSGHGYNIFVTSLIGKDNLAKAFYITLIEEH
jgi:PAS domain-containing protein